MKVKLSERSVRIKELIHFEVGMGTFGLVELELIEFDKKIHKLEMIIENGLGPEDLQSDLVYPTGD